VTLRPIAFASPTGRADRPARLIGGGGSRWRRGLCAATALATALTVGGPLPAAAQSGAAPLPAAPVVRLPALGESASDEFNLSAEKRLGEQIMRDIRRDPDYLDDPQLLDYLQSIWQPLVKAAKARGDISADSVMLFPYESFLVRDRTVNAFALPGGYVGVHLGLIAMTASRDELASVLAHELSHITQRHIARSISASSRASTLGIAATILAVLAAARSSSVDAANAAIVGGQAAMAQAQLNFSRDMEREADRNGIMLMTGAGFAPSGMAAMFEKLDQANHLNDNGSFPYLRSHPLTTERIGEARQRIDSLASAGSAGGAPLLHTLMQTRARVLMDASSSALRRLQSLDSRGAQTTLPLAERVASLYGAALASLQLRELPRAEQTTRDALALLAPAGDGAASAAANAPATTSASTTSNAASTAAARHCLAELAAQVALARGDVGAARLALAGWPDQGSELSRSELLLRAQLALSDGSALALRQSSEALQTWVADHRQDASAWQALSQAATRQGQPLQAARAEAESQAALGNLRGAIDRLQAGQQMARQRGNSADFIEASVIDARLRELMGQRRELQSDQRKSGASPEN